MVPTASRLDLRASAPKEEDKRTALTESNSPHLPGGEKVLMENNVFFNPKGSDVFGMLCVFLGHHAEAILHSWSASKQREDPTVGSRKVLNTCEYHSRVSRVVGVVDTSGKYAHFHPGSGR